MTPEQYQRVSDLFLQASEMDAEQQRTFLDSACSDDPVVRSKVEQMLQAHQKDASVLNKPVCELKIRCPHCHNPLKVVDDPLIERTCPSCGSNFSLLTTDGTVSHAGSGVQKIAHFELIDSLGSGAFGTVWKARDTKLDRIVALKVPRKAQLSDEEIEKFFREARAAAQIRHANIVSVHEVGRENDTIYIVSDFIEGLNLDDWLSDQRLTARESASLCVQLAQALHHAHEAGVVHRDLKPANIMLSFPSDNDDSRLTPHIMDFGLARREAGEITMTVEGRILGTPAYMSPEQARGQGHIADRRADIYSLGVILFKLLTNDLPFRGNMRMLLHHVIHDDAPSPRRLNNAIPRDLETICLKCLQKEPSRRYATAKDLADDLQRYLDGKPILARPVSNLEKTGKWIRRNPIVFGLVAAVFLVLVGGVIGIGWAYGIALENEGIADTEAKIAIEEKNRANWEKKRADDEAKAARKAEREAKNLTIETQVQKQRAEDQLERSERTVYASKLLLTQRAIEKNSAEEALRFLRDCQWDLCGWEHRYLSQMADCSKMTLYGHSDSVMSVAFSPDGSRIATASFDKTAKIWNAKTGMLLHIFTGHKDRLTCVAFSPDGKRLVTGALDSTVKFWSVETGKELLSINNNIKSVQDVAFSPDGNRILIAGVKTGLWDVKTGKEEMALKTLKALVTSVAFSSDGQCFLTGGYSDKTVRLWDVNKGTEILTIKTPDAILDVAFSPDGRRIIAGGGYQYGITRVWDAKNGKELFTIKEHKKAVNSVSFSP